MTKEVLIVLSVAITALGLAIFVSGHRPRKSLDVPLLSKHSMIVFGGCLILSGLLLSAAALTLVR